MDIRINADFNPLKRALSGLEKRAMPNAIRRTLNKLGKQAKTQAKREIRSEYNIKAGSIDASIALHPANYSKHSAELVSTGKRVNLVEFGARQNKRQGGGVVVTIKKGQRKTIKGGFIANVFHTEGERAYQRKPGAGRFPVRALTSLSIPSAFAADKVQGRMRAYINGKMIIVLEHELKYEISKGAR